MDHRFDVVVFGGGQAGLALGYYLARRRLRFVILDAAPRVGHVWRTRWDSPTLFTPARYSALPGLPFPGDPEHYPGKDAVADYLERYAAAFDLPVRLDTRVTALRPLPGGARFEIDAGAVRYTADQVVVATGPFQNPFVPDVARGLAPHVPGLYFLGLPWQHTRGSALIGWVGRDAEYLADRIAVRAAGGE